MKKITLLLFAFLSICLDFFKAQTNINVAAPLGFNSSFLAGPDGTQSRAYWRCVELITADELTALTSNSVTSIGFVLGDGTSGVACPGNITVYMENTSDVTFNKSTVWANSITGMNMQYNGAMTIPISTGATVITIPLSAAFTYTGGGIYLAFDWVSAGPFASFFNDANYMFNSLGINVIRCAMASAGVGGVAPVTLIPDFIRPTILFGAINTASNELGITELQASGKVSKLAGAGHIISTKVLNAGNANASIVTVSLSVAGANTFSTTTTIGLVNPGAVTSLSFAPFYPTANGTNTITVSLPPDANPNNNTMIWTQSVTCDVVGNNPPLPVTSYTDQTWGLVTGGILATQIKQPAPANLSSVTLVFGQDPGIGGKDFHAILADANGNIIATSNTITATAQMTTSQVAFDFYPPPSLNANTNYFIGIAFPQNTFPIGAWQNTTYTNAGFFQQNSMYFPTNFYFSNSTTSGPFLLTNVGYLGIEGVLSFSNTIITATASRTLICKTEELNSVILNATGATTYTWSNSVSGSSIAVTPTIAGVSGSVSYTVNGFNDQNGCRSAKAVVTVLIDACSSYKSFDLKPSYLLFPNPSSNGKFSLTGIHGNAFVEIYNSLGQLVVSKQYYEENLVLDLSDKVVGSYIVKIVDAEKKIHYLRAITMGD